MERIFISSVQKELAGERRALKDYIEGDALLRRFFEVFLFEDLPAADRRSDEVYLDEVDRCHIYIGLFANEYGFEDAEGVSPTEREFDRATVTKKTRLIYVKGMDDTARLPNMQTLIRKAGAQLIRRRFTGVADLNGAVYASLVEHLERTGTLRKLPFDASAPIRVRMEDISDEKIGWFVTAARRERKFALPASATPVQVLTHLNLLDDHKPNHAAILLFGKDPQRVLPTAEVKCLHFHGTEVRKPIPSYQTYKGTVFDLVDQSVDFVLSKIVRGVGTREHGPQAPVEYELPKQAVTEAIVNAIAHRDYTSNASVQVMLFADRLEVWNPGELPPALTPDSLRRPHASIPRNPLVAEPLFLAHYIEKAGTGTMDMIALCREAGLPEPEFRQDGGQFVMTLWRNWLTESVIASLNLNERQQKALAHLLEAGIARLANPDYRRIALVSKPTATRELEAMRSLGLLTKVGTTGKGTYYILNRKGLIKGSKDSSESMGSQRAQRAQGLELKRATKEPKRKSAKPRPNEPPRGQKK
jgi:predicted HTH transcriptional regulator